MHHTTLALCLPFSAYGDLQGRRRGIIGSGPLLTRAKREVSRGCSHSIHRGAPPGSGFTTTGIGTLALAGCGNLFCASETNIRLCDHERGLLLIEKGRQQAVSYLLVSFVGNCPQILHLCGRRGCLCGSFGCLFQMLLTLS